MTSVDLVDDNTHPNFLAHAPASGRVVWYASAACGSGKTYQAAQRAIQRANERRSVLILQPTKELIDRTAADQFLPLQKSGKPKYHVVHGGTVEKVGVELMEISKREHDGGVVVFATVQGFLNTPYFHQPERWILIIDETLDPLPTWGKPLAKNHGILTDHIILEAADPVFSRVALNNRHALEEKAKNKSGDAVNELLKDGAWMLLKRDSETYVHTERYQKLLKTGKGDLELFSVLQPSIFQGFGSVLITCADFEDTQLYRVWTELGVQFEEDKTFTSKLRPTTQGDNLTIMYGGDRHWSQKWMNTTLAGADGNPTTPFDLLAIAASREFQGKFLWQANVGRSHESLLARGIRLPNAPFGLNSYTEHNNLIFLSALNPTPEQAAFYKKFGLTRADASRYRYYATIYQSVMRCSLRDPNNTRPKRVIVPDRGAAEYLEERFPAAKVVPLDIGLPAPQPRRKGGQPRKHANEAAKQAAKRLRKKQRLLREMLGLTVAQDSPGSLRHDWYKEESYIASVSSGLACASVFSNPIQPTPFAVASWANPDPAPFFDILRVAHGRVTAGKQDNMMISPAIFDPAKPTKERESVLYLRHIWLDFEEGDLPPEEFARLFPNIRMVIVNTFQHTKASTRYRVIIPTTGPIAPEVYKLLVDCIIFKLREAGYAVLNSREAKRIGKQSGLDKNASRTPGTIFWLPCQAKEPSDSFFIDYDGPDRTVFNPLGWLEDAPVPVLDDHDPPPIVPDEPGREIDEAKVEAAQRDWVACKTTAGSGNSGFFNYGLRLRRAGMSLAQVEEKLREDVQFARNKPKRRRHIRSIMKFLRKRACMS